MFGLQMGVPPVPYLIFHLQMPCFHLKVSIFRSPSICGSLEYRHLPLVKMQKNHNTSVPWNHSSSLSPIDSLPRLNSLGALPISGTDIGKRLQSLVGINSSADQNLLEEVLAINWNDSFKSLSSKEIKERKRREKIGLANKGKVPWNKGRKHSAETRARIKQRTIEALNNPKVRKKMVEHPRAHSDQVKAKIGSSLKRVWSKRLKWKQSRDNFFHSWAETIAEAAKTGGHGQEELDWDSYDKIKQEIVDKQFRLAEEKIKAKELAKMEKAAQVMVKRMEKLAHKRKLHEERIKEKKEQAKIKRKLNQAKKDLTKKLRLQQKLSQIRQKISLNGQLSSRRDGVTLHIPAWEKLDLELLKGEGLPKEVSFADQIKAAKTKKVEFSTTKSLAASSIIHSSSRKS
ncbi:uncharacterized protein LOC133802641 isoform X1 [Humulus lupulus]|uniref:uncharacterized protein LOC133802641 isoform X1 n=2 Tax=Humulus lupulus TaxID=3486 RepID=UPI002B40A69B|nr:uncharacterized protein LOC133802641 isoform X1 [Humulus lupulus]